MKLPTFKENLELKIKLYFACIEIEARVKLESKTHVCKSGICAESLMKLGIEKSEMGIVAFHLRLLFIMLRAAHQVYEHYDNMNLREKR
jgi:hypothetical protein